MRSLRQRRRHSGRGGTRAWASIALAGLLVLSAGSPGARAEETAGGLFGYLEFPSDQLQALPLWREALARIDRDRPAIARCDADVASCSSTTLTVWRAKVDELSTLAPMRQLIEVNRFVNSLGTRVGGRAAPAVNPQSVNHWASPLEFLAKGGDAEDIAVMKFVTLRDAGVPNQSMRIVIVYDALKQQRHAVLAVRLAEGTFILDTVSNAVLPAERLKYYLPYYSVNETTRWAHVVRRWRPEGG